MHINKDKGYEKCLECPLMGAGVANDDVVDIQNTIAGLRDFIAIQDRMASNLRSEIESLNGQIDELQDRVAELNKLYSIDPDELDIIIKSQTRQESKLGEDIDAVKQEIDDMRNEVQGMKPVRVVKVKRVCSPRRRFDY